jgi:hypothetical protein
VRGPGLQGSYRGKQAHAPDLAEVLQRVGREPHTRQLAPSSVNDLLFLYDTKQSGSGHFTSF